MHQTRQRIIQQVMGFSFSSDLNFSSVVLDAVAMPPSIEYLPGFEARPAQRHIPAIFLLRRLAQRQNSCLRRVPPFTRLLHPPRQRLGGVSLTLVYTAESA